MRLTLRSRLLLGLGLFLLAFLPRVVYVFVVQTQQWEFQTGEMQRAVDNIVREGTIGNVFSSDSGPTAHVAPLYAYWVAIWHALFGVESYAARLLQSLFAAAAVSLAVALLPELARKLRLPVGPAIAAAVLWAIFPFNLWVETTGNWEQPYVPLVLIGLVMLLTTLHERGWQPVPLVIGGGMYIGFSALLCPVILPVVAGLLILEWFQTSVERRALLLRMGLLGAAAMLCITPWAYRNYRVLGGFVPIRSNFGLELVVGNNPASNGKTFATYAMDPNCPNFYPHPYRSAAARARIREVGELAFMKEKQAEAMAWITDHPGTFAGLTLARFRYYWFPPGGMWNSAGTETSLALELKAALTAFITLGCFGWLAWAFWRRVPARWAMLVLVVGPSLTYLITHVDLRYRYPVFGVSLLLCCQLLAIFVGPLATRMLVIAWKWQDRAGRLTLHPFARSR